MVKLIEMGLNGAKSIKKEIRIQFASYSNKDYGSIPMVKSIYGPNGVGKTGICKAVDFYRHFTLGESNLGDKLTLRSLNDLINFETDTLEIEMTYFVKTAYLKTLYLRHRVEIKRKSPLDFKLLSETVKTINTHCDETLLAGVVLSKDGEMELSGTKEFQKAAAKCKSSFSHWSFLYPILVETARGDARQTPLHQRLSLVLLGASRLFVCFGESEEHDDSLFYVENPKGSLSAPSGENPLSGLGQSRADEAKELKARPNSRFYDVISSKEKDRFEKDLTRMASFLRIMKPNLMGLRPSYEEKGPFLGVHLDFIYPFGEISYALESAGIKKLSRIFMSLLWSKRGNIVFIDEMDSDINNVYMSKMVSYFARQNGIQLIFTTHSIETMEPLRHLKYSIDFLSASSSLIPWANGGGRNPAKAYADGFIPGIPFNIGEYLFEEAFGDEGD